MPTDNQQEKRRTLPFNHEDEVIFDVGATTYTSDQAVAKLLGWSVGGIFPKNIPVSLSGVDEADLTKVASFDGTVNQTLKDLHDRAQDSLIESANSDSAESELFLKLDEVERIEGLIERARGYFMDIDDELADPQNSALKIHRQRTEETGAIHFTVRSFERWSIARYGQPEKARSTPDSVPENIEPKGDIDTDRKLGVKETNAYITLGLLMEMFADTAASKYTKPDGSLNFYQLAEALSKSVPKVQYESGKQRNVHGHSAEAIRKCLSIARRLRDEL